MNGIRALQPDSNKETLSRVPRLAVIASRWSAAPIVVAVLAVGAAGCKTRSAPDSGFLQNSAAMSEQRHRFPFQRVWVKPGARKEDYDFVQIAPVNTSYLMDVTGWEAANPGSATLDAAARDLAEYTRAVFVQAFTRRPGNRLHVVTQPGPRTAVIELAIVELVPSNKALTAAGLVAPAVGATAAGAAVKVGAGKPSIAIEGCLRDTSTGEVIFQFADREEPQTRVVNLQGLSWWSHADEAIRDWALQCVVLANTRDDQTVGDRMPFTLRPWSN